MAPVLTKSGAPSNRREKIPEGTLCVVCDDLASGIHYSVASCNGCKTFFRRALVNKQTFTCQFTGECMVGKNVRCVCRSCRLKKCFEQGMDPKAIQHDRDKIRYTKVLKREKEQAKALAEAELEKIMKVKEEIGSPGGPECSDVPSSSRMFNSEVDMMLAPETYTELDSTLRELMRIEKKLVEVRNAYRFDDQISTIWNMYIGSRALLSEDDWLSSATQMQPMLFALSERPQPSQVSSASPYRCARITPWSLREWFQRDLTLMMEWVKLLPGVLKLTTADKVTLQKNFALNFAVFQLTFYTRDTTVLAGDDFMTSVDQMSLEERLKNLKRRGEILRTSPPPPAPSFTSFMNSGLMNLANSLYKQPLAKKIKDEILEDEPTCSAYLRRLNGQAKALAADCSPSTSTYIRPSADNTLPAFLINNGLAGVTSFSEGINQVASNVPPLPPTMSTGLPGALSSCLASSLQASASSSAPTIHQLPPVPTGFFSALANSPSSLGFPPSPLIGASPLIANSPLFTSSPLITSSPMMFVPLMSTLANMAAAHTFAPPMEKEKTPEIDVETVSMDGRTNEMTVPFRAPPSLARSCSLTGSSSDVISHMHLMSMRSPAEPCCSSKKDERMRSPSPAEIQPIPSTDTTPRAAQAAIKDEPFSPSFSAPSSVKNPASAAAEKSNEKDGEVTELTKSGETTIDGSEERRRSEEDEETPCDPTPEAQIMNRINYPDGSFIERDKDRPSNDELYGLLIDGIWKVFRRLDIDQETFVLYKMMVFFNTELTHRGDHKLSEDGVRYVEQMRQKMYVQLLVHLQRKRGKDGLKVFSNLLLLGSTVSRVRFSLQKMFTMTSIFVPSNDLVDQLILRDNDERAPSPSAFRPYHPSY